MQHTRAHAPETHLELHDRLADHREQPGRQRDQLRRKRCVRRTGGNRRRRLPVPREQHRHEQLEPLQRHLRSFSRTHARAGRRRSRSLCTLPRVRPRRYSPRVRREYSVSTHAAPIQNPRWAAPNLVSGVECTRTAKRSGRLATASSAWQTEKGYPNCKARPRGLQGGKGSRRAACARSRAAPPHVAACLGMAWPYGVPL